jgi:hypothetical protein
MKFLSEKKNLKLGLVGIPLLVVASIFYYLYSSYERLNQSIESIAVVFNAPAHAHAPVVYIIDSADVEPNLY